MKKIGRVKISTKLPVTFLREGTAFIAYSPALDIATVGKTHDEAKRRFAEMVEIFFDELLERGKLERALADLGWQKTRQGMMPPLVISQENLDLHYASHHTHSLAKV